jgi:hypothetical protein
VWFRANLAQRKEAVGAAKVIAWLRHFRREREDALGLVGKCSDGGWALAMVAAVGIVQTTKQKLQHMQP